MPEPSHESRTFFDDPKSSSTAWVAAIGGLILLLLVLGLQLVFRQMEDAELATKESTAGAQRLAALEATQRGELESYVWIDREQGVLRMPIEAAMAQVAARYAGVSDR